MAKASIAESTGPATDRHNDPVVDPTRNVLDLVRAETKRQDDLRELDGRWRDRLDKMQRVYARDQRRAESDRIDAILEAAAVNVQRAADVQSGVAERLAGQVSGSAEVVRLALRAEVEPIQKDIADLRRVQYEGVGQKEKGLDARAVLAAAVSVIALGLLGFQAFRSHTTSGSSGTSIVCTASYHPAPCP
jgi:hypothetical protein